MSATDPLTTAADADRLGYSTLADLDNINGLILRVSARIRADVGQIFTTVEDDTVMLPVERRRVMLPQRPVTSVTAVTAGGTAVTGWQLAGNTLLLPSIGRWAIVAANGPDYPIWACRPDAGLVNVTYSHGFESVPDDVQAAVFDIIQETVNIQPAGVKTLTIDDFTVALDSTVSTGYIDGITVRLHTRYGLKKRSVILR